MPNLIIQLARFGDLIQTSRLIKSLPQEQELHLLLDSSLVDLAKIIYPKAIVHGLLIQSKQANQVSLQNQTLLQEISSLNFHSIYNLNFSPINFQLAQLFPGQRTHGYWQEEQQIQRSPWLRLAFRWLKNRKVSPLNLVDLWAWLAQPISPELVHPPAQPKGGGLAINLAGREARRSLPLPVLAPIAASVWQSLGGPKVQILGSHNERPLGRQLMEFLPQQMLQKTTNLAGKTSYADLIACIQNLDLLITPDTGSMHLAAALGTPVQAFFLSSALAFETGPYGLGHTIWQAQPECAPCLESGPCVADMECLQVFQSPNFLKFLQGKAVELPANLLQLQPVFDDLGQNFRVIQGKDNQAQSRAKLRALLSEYHGLRLQPGLEAELGKDLYQEIDWILSSTTK